MSITSYRECRFIRIKDEYVLKFIEKVKSFLVKEKIPEECKINIYKDQVICCGNFGGVVLVNVEIEGSKEQPVKDLDQKIYSKLIEICEREDIEYDPCMPSEIYTEPL